MNLYKRIILPSKFKLYVTTKLYGKSASGCNNNTIFSERTIFTFPTSTWYNAPSYSTYAGHVSMAAANCRIIAFVFSCPRADNDSVWLVAPLVAKLPSSVQGRVLKLAGQVLETGNNFWSAKNAKDKERHLQKR